MGNYRTVIIDNLRACVIQDVNTLFFLLTNICIYSLYTYINM